VEGHGIAVMPGDAEAFAKAVTLLAENPDLRERLGRAARAFAVESLARDAVLKCFEAEMERLLDQAANSAVAEDGVM
jgi:colanic acid biosynthesis glycosyl transferase WcaI